MRSAASGSVASSRRDHLADAINARDTDRTELPLGLLELLHEASVPTHREVDILMHANDEFALGPLESEVQAIRRTWAVLHHSDFVAKARVATRRSKQIALKLLVIRDASHNRYGISMR